MNLEEYYMVETRGFIQLYFSEDQEREQREQKEQKEQREQRDQRKIKTKNKTY
jgi:hypothetical protein